MERLQYIKEGYKKVIQQYVQRIEEAKHDASPLAFDTIHRMMRQRLELVKDTDQKLLDLLEPADIEIEMIEAEQYALDIEIHLDELAKFRSKAWENTETSVGFDDGECVLDILGDVGYTNQDLDGASCHSVEEHIDEYQDNCVRYNYERTDVRSRGAVEDNIDDNPQSRDLSSGYDTECRPDEYDNDENYLQNQTGASINTKEQTDSEYHQSGEMDRHFLSEASRHTIEETIQALHEDDGKYHHKHRDASIHTIEDEASEHHQEGEPYNLDPSKVSRHSIEEEAGKHHRDAETYNLDQGKVSRHSIEDKAGKHHQDAETYHLDQCKVSRHSIEGKLDQYHTSDEGYRHHVSSVTSRASENNSDAYKTSGDSSTHKQSDASFNTEYHPNGAQYHQDLSLRSANSGTTDYDDNNGVYLVTGDRHIHKQSSSSVNTTEGKLDEYNNDDEQYHEYVNTAETHSGHVNGELHRGDLSSVKKDDIEDRINECYARLSGERSSDDLSDGGSSHRPTIVNELEECHSNDERRQRNDTRSADTDGIEDRVDAYHDNSGIYQGMEIEEIKRCTTPSDTLPKDSTHAVHVLETKDRVNGRKGMIHDTKTVEATNRSTNILDTDRRMLKDTDTTTSDQEVTQPSHLVVAEESYYGCSNVLPVKVREDGWTDQDEEELREMFQTLDVDESGKLTCEEVRPALQYRGHNPTDEQVKMALKESDADGDGEYDYDEFKALVQAVERQMPDQATQGTQLQEALQIMMECLARDDDGTVTKEEFEEFLMGKGEEKLTQEEVDSFFDELDVDKTNTLTRDDLLIMLPPQKENAPEGE